MAMPRLVIRELKHHYTDTTGPLISTYKPFDMTVCILDGDGSTTQSHDETMLRVRVLFEDGSQVDNEGKPAIECEDALLKGGVATFKPTIHVLSSKYHPHRRFCLEISAVRGERSISMEELELASTRGPSSKSDRAIKQDK